MVTPHDVLGIRPGASDKEIKAAYKRLAKKHHPDVTGGNDQKFKEIGQAYEALTKPQPEPPPSPGGFSPFFDESIFADLFGRGAGAGGFGAGLGQHTIVNRLAVDPEILLNGGTFDVTTQTMEVVHGRIRPVNKTQPVTIEPDTPVLTKVALPSAAGNQFMFLELIPGDTAKYRVTDFLHLTETQEISVFTAMFGGDIEVMAPNRKTIKVKVPPGTQAGSIHRIRGLGLRLIDGRRGDYNVQITIHIPAITTRQKLLDLYSEHSSS